MTPQVVLLTGEESRWDDAPPERREATSGRHREFTETLEARS